MCIRDRCLLYRTLKNTLPEDVLHEIIRGAVDVERTFICEALSCDLIGMNPSTDEDTLKKLNAAEKLRGNLGHFGRSQEGV